MGEENNYNILFYNYFKLIRSVTTNIEQLHADKITEYRRKRRKNLQSLMYLRRQQLLLISSLSQPSISRRCLWEIERTKIFWEVDCQVNDENFFKQNFRMSRNSFDRLCQMLMGKLQRKDTNYRKCIPFDKRIAIALYCLGSSAKYSSVAKLFGIGKSTVCHLLIEFCKEVWESLRPIYLNVFPLTDEKIEECVKGFEILGFPQCLGAIDGCHIEIRPGASDAVDYFNYKGWYSMVLLALVDHRYRFLYINVGAPGGCNASQIYEKSQLKQQLMGCTMLQQNAKIISGVEVPVIILGDSAFSFSKTLMKPYPFHLENNEQRKTFNYELSKSRRVVENAFNHLKNRFRRIGEGVDNNIQNAPAIIKACCVLHNFLSEQNDKLNEKWIEGEATTSEKRDRNREYYEEAILGDMDESAERIRQALSLYFCSRKDLLQVEHSPEDPAVGVDSDPPADGLNLDGPGNGVDSAVPVDGVDPVSNI